MDFYPPHSEGMEICMLLIISELGSTPPRGPAGAPLPRSPTLGHTAKGHSGSAPPQGPAGSTAVCFPQRRLFLPDMLAGDVVDSDLQNKRIWGIGLSISFAGSFISLPESASMSALTVTLTGVKKLAWFC